MEINVATAAFQEEEKFTTTTVRGKRSSFCKVAVIFLLT